MKFKDDQHRAEIDDDGNVILPQWRVTGSERQSRNEHIAPEAPVPKIQEQQSILKHVRSAAYDVVKEGANQYKWSFGGIGSFFKSIGVKTVESIRALKNFFVQPIWIIRPNKEPKEYSRGTLFMLDTVRFGATFACIFLLLFVTLNYKSFWEITSERINPIQHAHNTRVQQASIDSALKEKLLKTPTLATAGNSNGDLLSFLPPVGPPDNRIIIPKLNLNVPLVTPSYESLLNEDWEQVEHDIQDALTMGVVHYPGTARPGQAGNFFVTGHSSYYPWAPGKYKTVFARLHNLDVGDEYYVYYGGDQHRYVIRSKEEVRPTNVDVLDQPLNRRVSTLMTCTPVGTTLRRLILVAEEIDVLTGEIMAVGEQQHREEVEVKPQMLPI